MLRRVRAKGVHEQRRAQDGDEQVLLRAEVKWRVLANAMAPVPARVADRALMQGQAVGRDEDQRTGHQGPETGSRDDFVSGRSRLTFDVFRLTRPVATTATKIASEGTAWPTRITFPLLIGFDGRFTITMLSLEKPGRNPHPIRGWRRGAERAGRCVVAVQSRRRHTRGDAAG